MSRIPARPARPAPPHCSFLPPYLLAALADATDGQGGGLGSARAARCARTLVVDDALRRRRTASASDPPAPRRGDAAWVIHSADNTSTLPGEVVRRAGEPASGDVAVDEAAAGVTGALALFSQVYGRSSYDGDGASVLVTVHFERDYANAFWDGTQLVFGDGDGEVFARLTKPVGVVGHELSHAVVQHTAALTYQDQSGALNESVCDAFAACLKQRLLDQRAAEADWLIGEGIFLPGVQGRALRDMADPGTAYDDPRLGRDPQPAHMRGYVETTDDNGGVHINSGIPNRAFHLAAVAIGGTAWEGAGRVWYAALTGGEVGPDTDFAGFAAATVAAAGAHADAVAEAWATVGVTPSAGSSSGGTGGGGERPSPEGRRVRVRRTGGIAGQAVEGEVDLETDDPDGELAALVARVDVHALAPGHPMPDRFVYELDVAGARATVHEEALTEDARQLATLVLERGGAGPVAQ